MDQPIRILIVEDLPTDAGLAKREISKALEPCVFQRVDTREDYLAALETFQPNLIVSDYRMPRFDGLTALKLALEHTPLTPVIILTAAMNEDTAVECMKTGATDYVIKEHIKRLGPAVINALEQKQVRQDRYQAEQALRKSEERFRSLYENATVGLYRTTPDGRILMANPTAVQMLGFDSFEELAQRDLEQEGFDLSPRSEFRCQVEREGTVTGFESSWIKKDGSTIFVREGAKVIRDEQDQILYYDGIFEDITERRQIEQELVMTQFSIDRASIGIVRIGPDARILSANEQFCRNLGYTHQELCNMYIYDIDPNYPLEKWKQHRQNLSERGADTFETTHQRKDGTTFPVEITANYIEIDGYGYSFSFVRDITERKQAEAAQAELEEQLRQAQKMESIGQLAGGIAHDFNNMLTVIQGYSELIQVQMSVDDPQFKKMEQIRLASERATALTRQLLAFSRKQMLAPVTLNLNKLVSDLYQMLERLIGEDITLSTILEPELWSVTADPGQIEQVIMNLAVNARDAMPVGGMLTIETQNIHLDDDYIRTHFALPTGPFVMLTVTDTGCGMDDSIQARIFEPFFTTKETDKGTGLGLATVYGIIKQSEGDITVYSEPGQGTTFKIHLPANETAGSNSTIRDAQIEVHGGNETILLAEDEESVRDLARATLESKGYTILEAGNGNEALSISEQHEGYIDLLITDVVMPQMSGRELAEHLKSLRPLVKILFMSGYTDDAVVRHGLLTAEVEFLPKPFSPNALVAKVREVLDK